MADSTLDVSQTFDNPRKLLRIIDTGDGGSETTYAVAVAEVSKLVPSVFDTIIINYTDATKSTISTIVYKTGGESGTTVSTTTYTSAATSDTYVRS